MQSYSKNHLQQNNIDQGRLQVTVLSANGSRPVENARVRITYTGDPENVVEELITDSSGKTPVIGYKDKER